MKKASLICLSLLLFIAITVPSSALASAAERVSGIYVNSELIQGDLKCLSREVNEFSNISPQTNHDKQSEENTDWKATVTATYTISGDNVTFSKFSGTWTQLRGTTTLSGRTVCDGIDWGLGGYQSGSKYPAGDSFGYSTGWSAVPLHADTRLGGDSSVTITLPVGTTRLDCVPHARPWR